MKRCFEYVERMENEGITKRIYVEECASSCSMGRLQKRWTDTVKVYLKKERDLNVRQVMLVRMIGMEGKGGL